MIGSTVSSLQDNSSHGEDSFLLRDLGEKGFLDAVMDGVTGHGGAEASQSLVEAPSTVAIDSPEDGIKVLEEVNDEFFQIGGGRFLLTTVSVLLCLGDRMYVIGAGDSPVFQVEESSIRQLTGRVGGFLHVGVSKAVGANAELGGLSRAELAVEPGARLVLATDGITDNMMADELGDIVRTAASPDEAAEKVNSLVEERLQEGRVPELLGRRFRHDDRTAIFRFFNP